MSTNRLAALPALSIWASTHYVHTREGHPFAAFSDSAMAGEWLNQHRALGVSGVCRVDRTEDAATVPQSVTASPGPAVTLVVTTRDGENFVTLGPEGIIFSGGMHLGLAGDVHIRPALTPALSATAEQLASAEERGRQKALAERPAPGRIVSRRFIESPARICRPRCNVCDVDAVYDPSQFVAGLWTCPTCGVSAPGCDASHDTKLCAMVDDHAGEHETGDGQRWAPDADPDLADLVAARAEGYSDGYRNGCRSDRIEAPEAHRAAVEKARKEGDEAGYKRAWEEAGPHLKAAAEGGRRGGLAQARALLAAAQAKHAGQASAEEDLAREARAAVSHHDAEANRGHLLKSCLGRAMADIDKAVAGPAQPGDELSVFGHAATVMPPTPEGDTVLRVEMR